MGTLTYVKGDVLQSERRVVAHGVNCKGVFGAGVARDVGQRYPEVKRAYHRRHRQRGWSPGDTQFVMAGDGKIIVNMATQSSYGRCGRRYVDYDAVRACFDEVVRFCETSGYSLAMPKIGSGLAGGDWAKIESILIDCLVGRDVEVDVHAL